MQNTNKNFHKFDTAQSCKKSIKYICSIVEPFYLNIDARSFTQLSLESNLHIFQKLIVPNNTIHGNCCVLVNCKVDTEDQLNILVLTEV